MAWCCVFDGEFILVCENDEFGEWDGDVSLLEPAFEVVFFSF